MPKKVVCPRNCGFLLSQRRGKEHTLKLRISVAAYANSFSASAHSISRDTEIEWPEAYPQKYWRLPRSAGAKSSMGTLCVHHAIADMTGAGNSRRPLRIIGDVKLPGLIETCGTKFVAPPNYELSHSLEIAGEKCSK